MTTEKKIKTALVSVFHKDGLDDIIKMCDEMFEAHTNAGFNIL